MIFGFLNALLPLSRVNDLIDRLDLNLIALSIWLYKGLNALLWLTGQ